MPTVRRREAPAALAGIRVPGLWDGPAATSPDDFLLIILLVPPSGNSEPFPGVCRWTTLQVSQRPQGAQSSQVDSDRVPCPVQGTARKNRGGATVCKFQRPGEADLENTTPPPIQTCMLIPQGTKCVNREMSEDEAGTGRRGQSRAAMLWLFGSV